MALYIDRIFSCLRNRFPMVIAMNKTKMWSPDQLPRQLPITCLHASSPTVGDLDTSRKFRIDRENFIQDTTQEII